MKTIFALNIFDSSEKRILIRACKVEDDIPVTELPMKGDTLDFVDSNTNSKNDWEPPVIRVRRFHLNEKWGERYVVIEMKTNSRALMDHLVANEGWKFSMLAA